MRALRASLAALALSACGAEGGEAPAPDIRPEVAPADFALLPCGLPDTHAVCAIVVAGGKRVLFGAPRNVASALSRAEAARLDGLMVFDLGADGVEGVDEVRNASWRAGRTDQLLVAGPEGIAAFAAALDRAFQASDALAMIDNPPSGGFDAATLNAVDGRRTGRWSVFDTGDLQIWAISAGPGRAAYEIAYRGTLARLAPCGARIEDAPGAPPDLDLTCSEFGTWPLEAPIWLIGGP